MYIRFETRRHGEGLFAYVSGFRDGDVYARMHRGDRSEFDRLRRLLWDETPAPPRWAYKDCFAREPRTWFKERAADRHVDAARLLCTVLNTHGVPMRPVRSSDPGRILWEDHVQIVVRPHRTARPMPSLRRGTWWDGSRVTIRRWRHGCAARADWTLAESPRR